MRRNTRNKVNALLAQIEHHIREEVETELTEKFTTPRKKPGTKREPRKERIVRAPLIDWTPRKQNRPRTLPLAPDPPEISMYD